MRIDEFEGLHLRPYHHPYHRPLLLFAKGSGGWWSTSVWLTRIGSSRVDASLVT